jgi:hypothetical protein
VVDRPFSGRGDELFMLEAEQRVAWGPLEWRMLKDAAPARAVATGAITATAFRDDRTAEKVTITDLTFDDCRILSDAAFALGERLRLHLHGQGWIEAEVRWAAADEVGVVFLTRSRC